MGIMTQEQTDALFEARDALYLALERVQAWGDNSEFQSVVEDALKRLDGVLPRD